MTRRTLEAAPAVRTSRRRPKAKSSPINKGSDNKPVQKPSGGYAHVADTPERPPTVEELASVDLKGDYPSGETPAIVVYGRRLQVMSLMVNGEPDFNIVEFCGRSFGMSRTQTKFMIGQIRKSWRDDIQSQSQYSRAEAIIRIRRDLSSMRSAPQKDWAAINRHEKLLSSLEGTSQPIKVTVTDPNEEMRNALNRVFSTISDEELRNLAAVDVDGESVA